jgi:hypothetical protein
MRGLDQHGRWRPRQYAAIHGEKCGHGRIKKKLAARLSKPGKYERNASGMTGSSTHEDAAGEAGVGVEAEQGGAGVSGF